LKGLRGSVRLLKCWKAIFFGLLLLISVLSADEIDKLIDEVRPGVNFASHRPNFSAREEEFAFDSNEGQIKRKLWVIKDGDKYVAAWHELGSKLYAVAATPARARTKIEMPPTYNTSGNTFDGKLGTRVTTFPYCYGFIQAADERRFKFRGGGQTITLTDTSIWTKEHHTEAVYVLTFRCDAVLGYVVDMDIQFKTDEEKGEKGRPFEPELVNLYPNHTFMRKMPDAGWRYEYTVYTPPNSDKYVGWINDFSQSDPADGVRLRNGGFSSFLFDPQRQGPALTCTVPEGINLRNATCNLQYDQHHLVSLPKKRDIDGFFNLGAKFRLVSLPPEITRHIMDQVEITDWRSNNAFPIRIGQTEDFETNRFSKMPEYAKGYRALPLTQEQAYSGSKSLAISGERRFRIDTQPVLKPNATYKLEAWVKVVKGEADDGQAYLLAQPAQWIPKGIELKLYQSVSVKDGQGWRKITLEFKNGPLGATYWLFAVAKGRRSKAYFDDVRITMVSSS